MTCTDLIFFTCIVFLVASLSTANVCHFGDEPNCGFPCRCKNRTCNAQTGACDSQGCQEDHFVQFEGYGCLLGNVAYRKVATEPGVYDGRIGNRSVDGDIGPADQNTCSFLQDRASDVSQLAWWSVDLDDTYIVNTVIIFNRNILRYRATYIDIRVGVTNTFDEMEKCAIYKADEADIDDLTRLECTMPISGQHVTIKRMENGAEPQYLNFCEVAVMAYKAIKCDKCLGKCDEFMGCSACPPGTKLPDCDEACPDGYTSVNCARRCGMCKPGVACDKVAGSCGQECEGWYLPESCTKLLRNLPWTSNVTILNITSHSATAQWESEEQLDPDVLQYFKYILEYGTLDANATTWNMVESSHIPFQSGPFNYELLNLHSGTEYTIKIVPLRQLNSREEKGAPMMVQFETLGRGKFESTTEKDGTTSMLHPEENNDFKGNKEPYIVAIIVGAVMGVIIMILVAVIVLLVVRQRRFHKPPMTTGARTKTNHKGDGALNSDDGEIKGYEAPGLNIASGSHYESIGEANAT